MSSYPLIHMPKGVFRLCEKGFRGVFFGFAVIGSNSKIINLIRG